MLKLAGQTPDNVSGVSRPGEALALLRICGRCELSAEAATAVRELSARLSLHEWDQVLELARHHGLESLVFQHLAQCHVLSHMPTHAVATLRSAYCATLVTNRRLEIERNKVVSALASRGVEVLLLKGVTLAERYYHEIALRPSSDIDLLVRREDLRQCLSELRDIGYMPTAGRGNQLDFDVLYDGELDYRNGSGVRVEPHLELARLPAHRRALATDQVWGRAENIDIGGVTARYLHPWDELAYLSVHYSVPHQASRLIWLVDVAELVHKHTSDLDWDGFAGDIIHRALATPVVVTFQHARDQLDLDVPPEVMRRLVAAASTPLEQQLWIAAHTESSNLGRLWRHLISLASPVDKVAFLWGASIVGVRKAWRRIASAHAPRRHP